jgi:hypothetical protein
VLILALVFLKEEGKLNTHTQRYRKPPRDNSHKDCCVSKPRNARIAITSSFHKADIELVPLRAPGKNASPQTP